MENNTDFANLSNESQEVLESREDHHEENGTITHISVVEQLEIKLGVGQIVASVDDAYLLYCSYAHAKGFSVKKGDQRYFSKSNEVQSKQFDCSCEGQKDEKASKDGIPAFQKPSIRTNCKARLRISKDRQGQWKVSRFEKEHNHEMLGSNHTHLLRSSRNVSHAKSSTLEAMVNAGIGVVNAISYMENEVNGQQYLGLTRKDAYNHLDRLRRHTKAENGDASALVQYFIDKSNKEPYFYWNVQVDDDGRIMNIFFRDHRCLVDYKYFGDVMLVDTTHKKNRYNLVCLPFVGINHHMQNVIFGLVFMSDETESSFEWLFSTFLDAMGNRQPHIIFRDQCQAMINAIETVFPKAHHRLCQWHINQNAHSHLGNLNGDKMFKQLWHKCMGKCDSIEEFEATWKFMMDKFGLSGHKWLNAMYKIRSKWATVFSNDKFSTGLLATSRSESTNVALKKASRSTITLSDFVLNFERTIKSWRVNESNEDARCLLGKPSFVLKNNPILSQVADIYTLNICKMFESELVESLNTIFIGQPSILGDNLFEFKVKSIAESSSMKHVVFDRRDFAMKCSCHKFETTGIFCKHLLKVMNFLNMNAIPEAYIKRRWMKDTKNRGFDEVGEVMGASSGKSDMVFVNQVMRSMYDLSLRCKGNDAAKDILRRHLELARHELHTLFESLKINDQHSALDSCSQGKKVLDPLVVDGNIVIRNPKSTKKRGMSNSRIVRHWDKSKKGKKKGKENINFSSAKISKGNGQYSQEAIDHIQSSHDATPPQVLFRSSAQSLSFASQFEINQQLPCYQYPMQGSGSTGVFTRAFESSYPS